MLPEDIRTYRTVNKLRDETEIIIRAIRPSDKQALVDGLQRQSAESLYMRFLGPKRHLSSQELTYLTEVDFHLHVALVAAFNDADHETPVGVGRYIVDSHDTTSAEMAIIIDEGQHGRGIGTLLLEHLCHLAKETGLCCLTGTVLQHNRKMIEVLENSRHAIHYRLEGHALRVTLDLKSPNVRT